MSAKDFLIKDTDIAEQRKSFTFSRPFYGLLHLVSEFFTSERMSVERIAKVRNSFVNSTQPNGPRTKLLSAAFMLEALLSNAVLLRVMRSFAPAVPVSVQMFHFTVSMDP
jgi:hypothetical protein